MNLKTIKKEIIDHVNADHAKELAAICQANAGEKHKSVRLTDFDQHYIYFKADGRDGKIPLIRPMKAIKEFKTIFIEMWKQAKITWDPPSAEKSIAEFAASRNSVVLGTLLNQTPVVSVAPLLRHNGKLYVFISQMAEHYAAIKQNPDKVRVMFLEDEKAASSVFNRKRVTYHAKARFATSKKLLDAVFDDFVKNVGDAGGAKMIKTMQDFHLVEIQLLSGRAVLGYGQAYALKDGRTVPLNQPGAGHKRPKRK